MEYTSNELKPLIEKLNRIEDLLWYLRKDVKYVKDLCPYLDEEELGDLSEVANEVAAFMEDYKNSID